MSRKFPRPIRRVVIKLGSSVIANDRMMPRSAKLRSLVQQVMTLKAKGVDVVLVSSGAIVLGMGVLNRRFRIADVAGLQAMAALGQTVLMRRYSELFSRCEGLCAQVLLTWDDFDQRKRYVNARKTLEALIERKVVPIVNENDTIATDEIRFGDNDKLSALVAGLIHADLLIMLTDVEGLYDASGKRKKIFREIASITETIEGLAGGTARKHMAKGGMSAKLQAVKIATQANIPVVIAKGSIRDVILRIERGERIGTLFLEREEKTLSRKHWISFGAKPKGVVFVDDGARDALLRRGGSLLLPGVAGYEGHFRKGDVLIVCDRKRHEIARGISNYSVTELQNLEGKDRRGRRELIHRDDLVMNARD